MHVTDRIKRAKRALGGVARWGGTCPPRKILISNFLRSLLVPFWGETARVGRPTANLVIVFETFKRSHNLKAWLRFAPRRGKTFLASYCMYSFSCCSVELRDTNTISGSLANCYGIRLCRLVWAVVYVVTFAQTYYEYTRRQPSKGGCICTPLDPPLLVLGWLKCVCPRFCNQSLSVLGLLAGRNVCPRGLPQALP